MHPSCAFYAQSSSAECAQYAHDIFVHVAHKSRMDSDWFKQRKQDLDITDVALAKVLGVERSVANKVVNGKVPMNAKKADAVAKLMKVSRDEILYRTGISAVPPAASPTSDHPPIRNASEGETTPIVALDLSLSMGPGTPIEEFIESEPIEFDIGLLRTITRAPYNRLRIVRGIGDSMMPKFEPGDRILVDTTARSLDRIDGYYWITLWGSHGLKRLRPAGSGRVAVISVNDGYDPIEVDANELTIEGRAIWIGREL